MRRSHSATPILVADDSYVNRRVAAALLTRQGYAAELVSDSEEALDAIVRQRLDLVPTNSIAHGARQA